MLVVCVCWWLCGYSEDPATLGGVCWPVFRRWGLVGLVGAWFAGHCEHVDLSGVCVDGVNDWLAGVGVVGKCCDAVTFCLALFGGFGDAF